MDAAEVIRLMREEEPALGGHEAVAGEAPIVACATLEDRRRLIVALHRSGWTYAAIASLLGLSHQRVGQVDRKWSRSLPEARVRASTRSGASPERKIDR